MPSDKIILESDRLVLRLFVNEDLDELWALYCDSEVTRFIPDAPRTIDEARAELEWHMYGHPNHPNLGLWATLHRATHKFIGRCGLLPWTISPILHKQIPKLILTTLLLMWTCKICLFDSTLYKGYQKMLYLPYNFQL